MKENKKYGLMVKKEFVEVSPEVYNAYYEILNREKWLNRIAVKRHVPLTYHDGVQEVEQKAVQGFVPSAEDIFVEAEDAIEKAEIIRLLREGLNNLEDYDRMTITEIYFNNVSERELARRQGISHTTLNYRKTKILLKLKELLKKN